MTLWKPQQLIILEVAYLLVIMCKCVHSVKTMQLRALTSWGCWLDADRCWLDDGQHSGLYGLDDDCVGLKRSCCVSQGYGRNQRLWLDGNLWADL